jgi:hydrogenase expression/formation protein HypD
VATGFEPLDVLEGTAMVLRLIAEGRAGSFVQYGRAVRPGGNVLARAMLDTVFEACEAEWRGLGVVPGSGLKLRSAYARFDATRRYEIPEPEQTELPGCQCGEVLRGRMRPHECPLFGRACTPRSPVGPCMVSSEGSCAARYKYG